MAFRASKIPDTYLWLGLGVCLFVAVKGVSYGLRVVYELTEVTTQPDAPQTDAQGTEDGQSQPPDISLASLEVLATRHTNTEIRKAATALIVQRFAASPQATELLAWDLGASPNTTVRRRAGHAASLLNDHNIDTQVRARPQTHIPPASNVPDNGPPMNPRPLGQEERAPEPPAEVITDFMRDIFNMPDATHSFERDEATGTGTFTRRPVYQQAGWISNHGLTQSAAQNAARRRRARNREAVVVNDGDRPISQEDIIQREVV